MKRGLLLINLGTPDAPTTSGVRRYLAQFLMDERVVDLPYWRRWLLVHGVILRVRPSKSAHAYQQIWTERGSPLLFHSQDLTMAVARSLGEDFEVALGMRYGNPSIPSALAQLRERGVTEIVVLPLYPQYAASSTSSSLAEVYKDLRAHWDVMPVRVVPAFFDHPRMLELFAAHARPIVSANRVDHVLFSFHGLPERQIRRGDPRGAHCLASPGCCDRITAVNSGCYRAQSFATARGLAERLELPKDRYSVTFQSRLGRTKWIEPYTDVVLPELARRGVKRIAVLCPSFVADCLETLEEIALRARAQFKAEGGEELYLVPSLNSDPEWVDVVVELARTPLTAR
jgi:protoporphyrin/coproporphyrin ferrochelatase